MNKNILNKLAEIERDYDIEILFAVESGSRAWGFASPDSDYDIRFVYRHKKEWYLNLWEQKDSIEFMTEDDLDGSGWDVRKALKLLAKSNASFLGWLFSPIVYRSEGAFLNEIRVLAENNFNPVSGFFHFHSMNKGFEETLGTEKMTLKSFFYAIRTALCAKWVRVYKSFPPVLFKDLYGLVTPEYRVLLDELILLKGKHIEKSTEPIDARLLYLVIEIAAENELHKNDVMHKKSNPEVFNTFFLKSI